eukprot:TRINITY_DN3093_c0_g1_i1.p1 TRINITY_DN3093_c0_g1~~TRINITY_DN3093_c0_g1_i1.p1  ORF type:complete len:479 (-),score=127.22 TRINITY_DN3093_c0_g1_i1:809-2245(-)
MALSMIAAAAFRRLPTQSRWPACRALLAAARRPLSSQVQLDEDHLTKLNGRKPIVADDSAGGPLAAAQWWDAPKSSINMEVRDAPGALYEVLRFFWKHDVNITRIESRPTPRDEASFNFFVDFNGRRGDPNVDQLLVALKEHTERIYVLDDMEVPWFPRHVSDLDHIADRTLDAGIDLQSDHPGFNDEEYRRRRDVLAQSALRHRHGKALPHIAYSPAEVETWGHVWDKMVPLHEDYACSEYQAIMRDLSKQIGYSRDRIPQQEDVSAFLQDRTGFSLRPVAGLLSSRDFLNALAFRVFFCTQYIRHHSMPLYTPEPDICHELLGHAPMFADPEFADFSQEFGLASLGASDEEITRLARVYWFSVEFGLCRQQGELKAYGAGLLSSFGELEYACAPFRPAGGTEDRPEYLPWEPAVAAKTEFPITCYQPRYFVADSLADAKHKMRYYCQTLAKPFHARYNPISQSIWVDRAVATQSRE